uniref:Uncharacterized protein n=1 Tax=Vitrella brassicaformis TaxID=1169539 RepID=A0A6U4IX42_9ALVE|mmetsp:Transcript_52496/g.131956  ORF Transcript_52496/g.131956 Transcript_52496/m.131956 type:complete len:138 (+) Transcript_52496:218-631(+)
MLDAPPQPQPQVGANGDMSPHRMQRRVWCFFMSFQFCLRTTVSTKAELEAFREDVWQMKIVGLTMLKWLDIYKPSMHLLECNVLFHLAVSLVKGDPFFGLLGCMPAHESMNREAHVMEGNHTMKGRGDNVKACRSQL